jgi:hypothetical protein
MHGAHPLLFKSGDANHRQGDVTGKEAPTNGLINIFELLFSGLSVTKFVREGFPKPKAKNPYMSNGLERNWLQVTCQRSITNGTFAAGVQDFNFSIGGRYGFNPAKSYFRFGVKLAGVGGAQPRVQDNLAMADGVIDNLYNNVYFRAGGSDVSSIVNYCPQAGIVKCRLGKSGAWLNSIGKSAYGLDADFDNRVNEIASDGTNTVSPHRRVPIGPANSSLTITAVGGIVDGSGGAAPTTWDTAPYNAEEGDILVVDGARYPITTVASDTDLGVSGVHEDVGPINANACYILKMGKPATNRKNEKYIMWQPPIGIFDHDGLLGSGDYKIQLNPRSDFAKAAVESLTNQVSGGGRPVLRLY